MHIKKGKKEKKWIKKKSIFFFRNFLWRDTGCFREKFALCEIENCVDFEDENKEVSDDAIDFEGKDIFFATFSGKVEWKFSKNRKWIKCKVLKCHILPLCVI